MNYIHKDSLAETIDTVQAELFAGKAISQKDKVEISEWLASRQGLPGSYRGMFAPTEKDRQGVKVFTGESVVSQAAIAHILSEETCRLLLVLGCHNQKTDGALKAATESMYRSIRENITPRTIRGRYCCGTCSAALWRHLAAGGLPEEPGLLEDGIKTLPRARTGEGRWRFFPFYYTLLALSEAGADLIRDEVRYCAPACERALTRINLADEYGRRRKIIVEKILAMA